MTLAEGSGADDTYSVQGGPRLVQCQRQVLSSSFSQEQRRSLWSSPSQRQWQSACLGLHGEPSLGALRGQPGVDLGSDQAKVEASAAPSRAAREKEAMSLRMVAIVSPSRRSEAWH